MQLLVTFLFCFNCPDSYWFPERFALFIVLTFQFVLLLLLLKRTRRWPASSGGKYRCHVNLQQSKPGNKNKWICCRCSKSLKKISSERTKTNRQTCALFSLFLFLLTAFCPHNVLVTITIFFLKVDRNHADELCPFPQEREFGHSMEKKSKYLVVSSISDNEKLVTSPPHSRYVKK